ncbi:MAG: hypothetical protein AB7S69_04945 [Salinivirgaceae bacterium]
MKIKHLTFYLVALFLSAFAGMLGAQPLLSEYDSLPMVKPNLLKNKYRINEKAQDSELLWHLGTPKAVSKGNGRFWKNVKWGALTLFIGIDINDKESLPLVIKNTLTIKPEGFEWTLPIFITGVKSTSRERVKDEDGNYALETEKVIFIDWSQEARGLIIEEGDTLGWFTINTNLQLDSTGIQWLERLDSESRGIIEKLKRYQAFDMNYNFVVKGNYDSTAFMLVTNGNTFRSLLLFDNQPMAIFQFEPDFIIPGKKNRINPYLLYRKEPNIGHSLYLMRFALLSRLLAATIATDYYEL